MSETVVIPQGPRRHDHPDDPPPANIPTERWPEEHLDPWRHADGHDD